MSEVLLYRLIAVLVIFTPAIVGFLIADWLDKEMRDNHAKCPFFNRSTMHGCIHTANLGWCVRVHVCIHTIKKSFNYKRCEHYKDGIKST